MIEMDWIQKTAKLSRLKLSDEEIAEFIPQLQSVLDHVDQLSQAAGLAVPEGQKEIEPWTHPLLELLPESTSLRSDELRPATLAEGLISSAPEVVDRAFQLPQAVRQDSQASGS